MAYQQIQTYIQDYWPKLLVKPEEHVDGGINLPNPFIAPSAEIQNGFVFLEQFYWDTYFTILGLDDLELKKGMVENLFFMFEQYGYIPNSSNLSQHWGRSQPPVLTLLIRQIYDDSKDLKWLERAYKVATDEYKYVWMSKRHPHSRLVYSGLSRYYHADQTHRGAEDESGWDYTTRFDGRALDWLPVDLNCLLYKYEIDLFFFASMLGRAKEAHEWAGAAMIRKKRINSLMFNADDSFYYDYDFVNDKQGKIKSLAGFYPLFVGLVDETQALDLMDNLKSFRTDYGLTTTAKNYETEQGRQWASPNGWAPLHYIVVEGLRSYGHGGVAREIADSWVKTVTAKFEETGFIYEKYNVLDPGTEPVSAVYPDQRGFAWTNAVVLRFIRDYSLN